MSKSVDKAITVLNCFSLERPILSVGEISGLTGYTKSTVSRLLTTLQRHGCVERTGGLGKYQLGYRINLWANMGVRQNNLVNIARSIMEKLRNKCGEEIALYVIEGDRRVCVERVESLHEIPRWDLSAHTTRCMPELPARFCWHIFQKINARRSFVKVVWKNLLPIPSQITKNLKKTSRPFETRAMRSVEVNANRTLSP